jgi:hypothetical protein
MELELRVSISAPCCPTVMRSASRGWETSGDCGDELTQLADQNRLEVDFTFRCLPVGALQHRL